MSARIAGALLFLPIPLVLWLFTRPPFGVTASVALGVAIMATHRFYARPFALRHAAHRCLWCGRSIGGGTEIRIEEPGATTNWKACGERHATAIARVLGWADQRKGFLRVGILGTLILFLFGVILADHGQLGPIRTGDAIAFFRLGIALTVLPLGWLSTCATIAPERSWRSPFPLHVPSLIGMWSVLWLFRLVGVAWFVLAALWIVRRLG